MTEFFKAGDKVRFRGMQMPAEILSGPHKSQGNDRFLIKKADGNVSLVPRTQLQRVVTRIEQVSGTLAMNLFGLPYATLTGRDQLRITTAAKNAITIADRTRELD